MLQDVDVMLAELEPPQLKLHGVVYTGRHLSFEEQVELVSTLDKLASAEAKQDFPAMVRHMRVVIDRIFAPPPVEYLGRWPFRKAIRADSVADKILRLPPMTACTIVLGFLKSLRSEPPVSSATPRAEPGAEGPTPPVPPPATPPASDGAASPSS